MKGLPNPDFYKRTGRDWSDWAKDLISRFERSPENKAPQLPSFSVTNLPSAADAGVLIYIPDETGGAIPAFSDGTNWRRVTDRAVVS